MKRLLFTLLGVCLLMACVCSPASAAAIDPAADASLALQYRYDGTPYGGLTVQTWQIATVDGEGAFSLTGDFAAYPVSLAGVTSHGEWDRIASTLAGYAAADEIPPTYTAVTDDSGTVVFGDAVPGMYLTLMVQAQTETATLIFDTFLTAIPQPTEDGGYLYHVTAYPKCSSYTPTPSEREYTVIKQWRDSGYGDKRPAYIEVDILRNGEVYTTRRLTAAEDWCYRWSAADDGSLWQAVERSVPQGYTVTVEQSGTAVVITNTYHGQTVEPPSTGDTFVAWPYLLAMGLSGGVLLLLAVGRRRKEA